MLCCRADNTAGAMEGEGQSERTGTMDDIVEEFIKANEVDGGAADALRDSPRQVQQAVIDRGGLSGARNPSSVLLARIRDASAPVFVADGDPDAAGYVRLRGIPFSATREDILHFFDGLGPLPEGVVIGTTREGRLSGEAFVQFPSVAIAKEAIEQRNRATMGDRYIELFPSTAGEAQRAAHGEPRHAGGGDYGRWGSGDDRSSYGSWSGFGSSGERYITEDEVEQFISSNGIDEHAAGALRDLPTGLQAVVIDRGGLGNARNPSSVLLSRIRDTQGVLSGVPPPPPPGVARQGRRGRADLAECVEKFIEESEVDDQAAEAFRNCHPDVQEEVMQRGVSSARNPSSALRARIRDVENGLFNTPARPSQAPLTHACGQATTLASIVEDFIHANGLDERAAEALRSCQPFVQEAVMERGDLVGTRNPSSAVLARIKDAQHGPVGDRDGCAGGLSNVRGAAGSDVTGYGNRGGGQRRGRSYSLEEATEDFIHANYLDERAGEALRSCPPSVQEAVLDRGDLVGTRNPSSAVLARIKDIQSASGTATWRSSQQHNEGPCSLPGTVVDDIEYLLRIYAERDERAADLLARIRSAKYSVTGGYEYQSGDTYDMYAHAVHESQPYVSREPKSYSPRGSRHFSSRERQEDRLDAYIRANSIDAQAADTLRRADPAVIQVVMEKGVSTARNPSSALLARLRDIESRMGSNGRDRSVYDAPPQHRRRSRLEDDVEAFIGSNGVDDMAADTLRRCSSDVQEAVMEKGISGARNPSSALLARIRDAEGRAAGGDRRGHGGTPARGGGDRFAPY